MVRKIPKQPRGTRRAPYQLLPQPSTAAWESTSLKSSQLDSASIHKNNTSTTTTIGPEGGTVNLYGVSLKIPPGAQLEEKKITLGITQHDHYPNLDDSTVIVSPVVSCEPHMLHFSKPVELVCCLTVQWQRE